MEKKSCCSVSRDILEKSNSGAIGLSTKTSKQLLHHEEDMVTLPGGEFIMGTDGMEQNPLDGEGPTRKVTIRPFAIDIYAVTNKKFKEFINETGYVTDAEKYGWSFVFHLLPTEVVKKQVQNIVKGTPWWLVVMGASWKHPEGPESSIEHRLDHPVVHVSWNDAVAYCEWSGKRLPTEAEWEYAARGGLVGTIFPWGNELLFEGSHRCNVWQGKFPLENNVEDGYLSTAPVNAYKPNGFGLYNVIGNVWEWCSDWFSTDRLKVEILDNPNGPATGKTKLIKGGSYLCHSSYCNRYRIAARSANTLDSSTGNMGFRCVIDID
ncbi:MAG: formylglycine-generating enzyme family protein [Bacillaceae bacterium]